MIALNLAFNKNKLCKTSDYYSKDMLSFDFSENGLGIVSPPYFMYDFPRKKFLMLHSINWSHSIVWLPLFHEILSNMCIPIVCFPGCDVINIEIKLIFSLSSLNMTKKSRQKFKYLENEKSFKVKSKAFSNHFYRAFSCQKLSLTWECAFKYPHQNLFMIICRLPSPEK